MPPESTHGRGLRHGCTRHLGPSVDGLQRGPGCMVRGGYGHWPGEVCPGCAVKFRLHKRAGHWWTTIVGRNGQVVWTSETYTRKASAVASAWSLVHTLSNAEFLGKADADGLPILPKRK